MAYPAYPRRVTRAHRKKIIDLVGEDSIVHGREVGLFELMTALETPDVSNQQVRSADYLGMQSVTACNDTCIRGD